jgi:predicted restriction endonuclease
MELLEEELDDLPSPVTTSQATANKLKEIETRFLHASPEMKSSVSRTIERGSVGTFLKKATKFKCQLCDALGMHPIGFLKKNGDPYVEAHHVMPVSKMAVGSLAASNVMILCANHHRQLHYGQIEVTISSKTFDLMIGETSVKIARLGIATSSS